MNVASLKCAFIFPIAPILLNLGPPWGGGNPVAEKGGVALLTAIVQTLALTAGFVLLDGYDRKRLKALLMTCIGIVVGGLLRYLVLFLTLTEIQPGTSNRLIIGLRYSSQFNDLLAMNVGNVNLTKEEFGFQPLRMYQRWSVYASVLLVVVSWLGFFGGLVFYLGVFAKTSRKLKGGEPIETLPFPDKVRDRLRDAGIRTIDDLCSKSEAELDKLPGVGKKTIQEVVDVLTERGMRLRG